MVDWGTGAKVAGAVAATLAVGDGLWLSLTGRTFYFPRLEKGFNVPEIRFDVGGAAFAYVALFVAFVVVALLAVRAGLSPWEAAGAGALVGFGIYATWNGTNRALVGDYWSWELAGVDTAWGTTLGAAAVGIATLAASHS